MGTFVVSIAHYMRAYFNRQALTHGNDFSLPGDVGFLNVSAIDRSSGVLVHDFDQGVGCACAQTGFVSAVLSLIKW